MENIKLSTRINELMEAKKLNQTQLANICNCNKSAISRICRGDTEEIGTDLLRRLAIGLNVSTDYLLGLTNEKEVKADIKAFSKLSGLSTESINRLVALNTSPNRANYINPINDILEFPDSCFLLQDLNELINYSDYYSSDGIVYALTKEDIKKLISKEYDFNDLKLTPYEEWQLKEIDFENIKTYFESIAIFKRYGESVYKEFTSRAIKGFEYSVKGLLEHEEE